MSEDREQFEKQLQRQSLRPLPSEWRQEILSVANAARMSRPARPVASGSFLSTLNQRLTSLLWPHPMAWGGLAAVWICICALNLSLREQSPALAKKTASPTPEVIAEVQQQQHLYAQLLGVSDFPTADRPKELAPKPRSESIEMLAA